MTRHTVRNRVFDFTEPFTETDLAEFRKSFKAIGEAAAPWAWFEREVAIAERTLRAIEHGEPGADHPDIFKPHVGPGWFSQEIAARAKWITNAKVAGEWELVARFSYEIGHLASTIGLTNAWNDEVAAGLRHHKAREGANKENRLASDTDRRSKVLEILEERGRGLTDAFAIAGKRYPEWGKARTFKESYYKKAVQS